MLRNFPVLERSGVDLSLCAKSMTDFYVQDCAMLNPVDMLIQVMEAQDGLANRPLKRIRAVGFNATYTDTGSYVLDRLAELANGTYVGLDSSGLAGDEPYPVLDGELTIHSNVYQDSIDTLQERFPKLKLNIIGERYVRFKDTAFQQICADKYGDGRGVTQAQLDAVTGFAKEWLWRNATVKDLSDLHLRFKNLIDISGSCFREGNFEKITVPKSVEKISPSAFEHNFRLTELVFEDPDGKSLLKNISHNIIYDNESMRVLVLPTNLQEWTNYTTRGTNIKKLYCKATTPPKLGRGWGDNYDTIDLFVPKGCASLYAAAEHWDYFRSITEYDFALNPDNVY